jgi:hypothetical protein
MVTGTIRRQDEAFYVDGPSRPPPTWNRRVAVAGPARTVNP